MATEEDIYREGKDLLRGVRDRIGDTPLIYEDENNRIDPGEGTVEEGVQGGRFPSTGEGMTLFERIQENYEWAKKKGFPWGGMERNWQNFWNHGSQESVDQMAYDSMREILGRDVSEVEFRKWRPYFTGDQNEGWAYLARVKEQEDQEAEDKGEEKDPADYESSVKGLYQDVLGREATADELEHYSTMMAKEGVDAYSIRQYLQEQPEYWEAQDAAMVEGLAGKTLGFQEQAYEKIMPQIMSQYKKTGKANSSSLDFAMTEAWTDLERQRQQFLSGLSASQYGGRKDLALQNYRDMLNQYRGDTDYMRRLQAMETARGWQNEDVYRNRAWETADYNRQSQDYANWMRSQGGGQTDWLKPALSTGASVAVGSQTGWNPYAMMATDRGVGAIYDMWG